MWARSGTIHGKTCRTPFETMACTRCGEMVVERNTRVSINWHLLDFASVGSIAGAVLGSWLMHKKLDANQVKKIIGIVLSVIAAKMAWGVL